MAAPARWERTQPALLLGSRRLQTDLDFLWVSGGGPYSALANGNGQPQRDGRWGLWYSPARPLAPPDFPAPRR